MSEPLPLDQPSGDPLVDRGAADALARDYRTRGVVRVGRGRLVVRIVVGLVVVVATYFLAMLAQVAHTGGSHGSDPVDAIMVMGAAQYDGRPSPQLAARLDHVVTLWNEGVAPSVIVTGGNIPGDRFTEAEASASYLVERGVPADAIVEVGEGNTTYESVAAAAAPMVDAGVERVALVTDPYHALRSRLIVEAEGFEVDVASTPSSVVTGWASFKRQLGEAAGVSVGRLIGFGRLSDITD